MTQNLHRGFQTLSRFCRVVLCAGCFWLIGCTGPKPQSAAPKLYTLNGTVVRLNAKDHTATINGEAIQGWMDGHGHGLSSEGREGLESSSA